MRLIQLRRLEKQVLDERYSKTEELLHNCNSHTF